MNRRVSILAVKVNFGVLFFPCRFHCVVVCLLSCSSCSILQDGGQLVKVEGHVCKLDLLFAIVLQKTKAEMPDTSARVSDAPCLFLTASNFF